MVQPHEAPSLAGQVALVTGSAHNIGRAIALALAGAGADVVIHARTSRDEVEAVVEEARALGVRATSVLGDVRDPSDVEEIVSHARKELGPISVLVNSAAIRPEGHFEEMTFDQWRAVHGTIVDGAFLCSRAVIEDMLAREYGSIINIVGLTAHSGAPMRAHVVSAKAALIGFTKALAVEFAGRGITVNGISPGMIEADPRPGHEPRATPAHRADRVIPVGRMGRPHEVASMCCYLASQHARYITGQIISVNGGVYL
jgi:3-oxoacyl-[acyl-carrier protein] reductase